MRTRFAPTAIVVAAAVVVGVVAVPLVVGSDYDSYPLSTYPMFAHERDRVATVATAVAVDGDQRQRLSSRIIGGTDEPMLAAESVAIAIRTDTAEALCDEIATRAVAARVNGTIEVVAEQYDTLAWFDGDREPVDRVVYASCEVPE